MTQKSTSTTQRLSFRKARCEEADFISQLINSAYRGDSSRAGWTTEADLLEGERTDEAEIVELIEAENSVILLCVKGDEVIGTVHVQKTDDSAYLGMLVVKPGMQGGGIGKQFMKTAEDFARREWSVSKMWMTVISVRPELIAYYERRGYRRTGERKPFPAEAKSTPRIPGLEFEVLEKDLDEHNFQPGK
jgi:ribosomal protein S18 acetylase RimI-like enzyme